MPNGHLKMAPCNETRGSEAVFVLRRQAAITWHFSVSHKFYTNHYKTTIEAIFVVHLFLNGFRSTKEAARLEEPEPEPYQNGP
jgi:hypothetical protein